MNEGEPNGSQEKNERNEMKTAACIELRLYQITSTTLCRVCWPTRVPPATVVGSGTS